MIGQKKGTWNCGWSLEAGRKGADRGAEVAAAKLSPAVDKEGRSGQAD